VSSGATAPAGTGPRTIVLPGTGTQTRSYTLPPGIYQYVQSVLVHVDATAAPAVRPTLRVKEQSGVVIATKRQGQPIPSGDTGTATWALRLVDEPSGPGPNADCTLGYQGVGADVPRVFGTVTGDPDVTPNRTYAPLTLTWKFTAGRSIFASVANHEGYDINAILARAVICNLATGAFQIIVGNNVVVPANSTATLDWTFQTSGAALLNLAAPLLPTVFVTGIYAISVSINVSP